MWPVIGWYIGHIWPILTVLGLVAILVLAAVLPPREKPMPNCFICDRPGTVRLYATVAVCADHADGLGGESPLISHPRGR